MSLISMTRITPRFYSDYNPSAEAVAGFTKTVSYLKEHPSELSSKSDFEDNEKGISSLAKKYFNALNRIDIPKSSKTKPDEIISYIIRIKMELKDPNARNINAVIQKMQDHHREMMSIENAVGLLLERYIYSKTRFHQWSWVCGSCIQAVDFINKTGKSWELLQVKNRSNTENSSSQKVRNNTTIRKWFRSNAGNNEVTNWPKLNEIMKVNVFSEEDFKEFVCKYFHKYQSKK